MSEMLIAAPARAATAERNRLGSPNPRHRVWGPLADYLELTKPRLTLLAVLTALVGFCLRADNPVDGWLLAHCLAGTALVGAGVAALNQFLERRADARMARTADRPLPAGRLAPTEGLVFGLALAGAGLLELFAAVNPATGALAAFVGFSYLLIYTPLKRVTPLCTLAGAVSGALPSVMGYTAAGGSLDATAGILFAILFLWQIPHFLAIAVLYREEYRAAGMPMLPVVDHGGGRTGRWMVVSSVALLAASLLPVWAGVCGLVYLFGAGLIGVAFTSLCVLASVRRDRAAARRLFVASLVHLPLLLGAMAWDKLS